MSPQRCFAEALLDPEQACPPGLITWNASDPARRFAVYRNNVIVSLVDALADTFAVTQDLVGEAFFRAMARVFAYTNPPTSRLLVFYGETFPEFIERFPPAASLPYLADVARLEFLRVRAYHAADVAPVRSEDIVAVLADEDKLPDLGLALHPSLAVLDSAGAVVSLWAVHQGVGDLATLVPDVPETALVVRDGLDVEVMKIPRATGVFIKAVKRGATLGDAMALAQRSDPDFDATLPLALLIQKSAITALYS
ncbi:MAG: putative DNA-binding domain-containing protein [Propionivibrio sp.]|nr:putative DNA-binding domain-containing protein [Propionivibrio sp.]